MKSRLDPESWLGRRVDAAIRSTIPACLSRCHLTGRLANFSIAAGGAGGELRGRRYDDSDVYRTLEGIARALALRPDPSLESQGRALVDLIVAAQQPDGYLNTYYTVAEPAAKWKDVKFGHELYCAGHLIEAAVAWRNATGDRKLFDCALALAAHIDDTFGPGKRPEPPGHPEIEIALVTLFRATGDRRWLDLARFFLAARGRHEGRASFGEYAQDHAPIAEQTEAKGHAVRALYLYSAAADLAALDGSPALAAAVERLYDDVVTTKSYVTGGVGSSPETEGFTAAHDLPLDGAYCETCASIALVMLAERLLDQTGDASYADRIEHVLENALLSGISLDGEKFFYVNRVVSDEEDRREPWFECACCPTNLARFLPRLPDLAVSSFGDGPALALFAAGTFPVQTPAGPVTLAVSTSYPLVGSVFVTLSMQSPGRFTFRIRRPSFQREASSVMVNGRRVAYEEDRGWLAVTREWSDGDEIAVGIPLVPERIEPNPEVAATRGRVALRRGPLVFCVEALDHGGTLDHVTLPPTAKLRTTLDADLPGGTVSIRWSAESGNCRAIPYAHRAHREGGAMRVWLRP